MAQTIIKYDGPVVQNHKMDISDLAPSLLALSDLIKEANKCFNGDRSGVSITVNTNLEQHCFELLVEVTQRIWDKMTVLIADHRVIQAKEILEWLGIVTAGTTGVCVSLYALIKRLNGKKIKSVTKIINNDKVPCVLVILDTQEADTIEVPEAVWTLYSSRVVLKKAIAVLAPLRENGYKIIQFYKGKTTFISFNQDDVPELDACPSMDPSNTQCSSIRTQVRIRKPAYEGRSKWILVYKNAIEASIDDTVWLHQFQTNHISAPPNCQLDVTLEEEFSTNEHGEAITEPVYRVVKVHKVIYPPEQLSL